jgi:hypothetical protein
MRAPTLAEAAADTRPATRFARALADRMLADGWPVVLLIQLDEHVFLRRITLNWRC